MIHSDTNTTFTYEPLSNPSAQIRLLDLQPGRGRSRIECRLKIVDISASKHLYEPLSYCWGKQDNQDIALVNETRFAIGRNLSRALKQLRDPERVRPLWVDAVCINQTDVQEKNAQIPLMRQIYENGAETIIWLGDSSSWNAHLAFQFMLKDAQQRDQILRAQAGADAPSSPHGPGEAGSLKSDGNIASRWYRRWRDDWKFVLGDRALRKMLTSDWFTRVWVIQEVAVSKRATIYWGGVCGSWELFEDAYPLFPRQLDKTSTLKNLILQRVAYQSSEDPENLAFAAYVASAANATDLRDKIYGVIGLADPETTLRLIEVDYNISPAELFMNFTRRYLAQCNDPGILAHSVGCDQQDPTRMPSWTFRPQSEPWYALRNGLYAWDYDAPYSRLKRPQFQASGASSFSPVFEDDRKRLGLLGYQVDTIESTAEVMEPCESMRRPRLNKLEVRQALTYLRWRRAIGEDMNSSYRGSSESMTKVLRSIVYSTYGNLPENDNEAVARCESFILEKFDAITRFPPAHENIAKFCAYAKCGLLHLAREAGYLDYDFSDLPTFMQCANRRLIKTNSRYLGLAPRQAQAGDHIVLVAGSRAPFVLRKAGENYKIVGDCYLHGMMSGENWDERKCERLWIE